MSLGGVEVDQKTVTNNIVSVVNTYQKWKDNKYVSAIEQALLPVTLNGIVNWDNSLTPQEIAEYILGASDRTLVLYWITDREELSTWLEKGDEFSRVHKVVEEIKLKISSSKIEK